jgi:hypothetical protein
VNTVLGVTAAIAIPAGITDLPDFHAEVGKKGLKNAIVH